MWDLPVCKDGFRFVLAVKPHGCLHNCLLVRRAYKVLARVSFQAKLHYLGQNNIFVKACEGKYESACYEMLCRDIHKHGVDL